MKRETINDNKLILWKLNSRVQQTASSQLVMQLFICWLNYVEYFTMKDIDV